jgi:hypothetical protein
LFLGRQLRERWHGLAQQFSHSPMLAQPIFVTHSFACATSNSVTKPPNCGGFVACHRIGRANDRMLAPDAIATNWRPFTM